MKSVALEKRAREVILKQMDELGGEITTEGVMELIRPHFSFNVHKAREQAIRRKANNLMARFRDERGIRTCFNCKDGDGNSKYINIEITKDLSSLGLVEKQLNNQYYGLQQSKRKLEKRRLEVLGQMAIFKR